MKSSLRNLSLILVLTFLGSCHKEEIDINAVIHHFKHTYAPDSRVALFDIQWEDGRLLGESNDHAALNLLKDSLRKQQVAFQDETRLLPDEKLNGKNFAVVTLSVANLRSNPKHSAELSTQATMGTPLRVLKKLGDWYLVQTPDRYISWVDAGGIALMDQEEMDAWHDSDKLVFTPMNGFVFESPQGKNPVSDLTAGNILEVVKEGKDYHHVKMPDGRTGFAHNTTVMAYRDWIETRETTPAALLKTARNMMGVPYLWGGTSTRGMDCSGFTKTVFFLNGKIIPRDASQQVHEGELVDTQKNWENLDTGDLLFFGTPTRGDKPERVVHVGMWIGNKSFIHASGRVRISSFDPASPLYDEYENNRYLRTKRIVGTKSQHILAVNEVIN